MTPAAVERNDERDQAEGEGKAETESEESAG